MDGNFDFLDDAAQKVLGPKAKRAFLDDDVPRVLDDEFTRLGYTPAARLSLLGNVGRENGWRAATIFGTHADPKNSADNSGIISWQGTRRSAMLNYLRRNGGDLTPNETNLRLMARFMDNELKDSYGKVHATLKDPNADLPRVSRSIRDYINYVPDAPYNTPDAEFDTVNNRKWAERARKLGLGQFDYSFLDRAAQQVLSSPRDITEDLDAAAQTVLGQPDAKAPETPEQNALLEQYQTYSKGLPKGQTPLPFEQWVKQQTPAKPVEPDPLTPGDARLLNRVRYEQERYKLGDLKPVFDAEVKAGKRTGDLEGLGRFQFEQVTAKLPPALRKKWDAEVKAGKRQDTPVEYNAFIADYNKSLPKGRKQAPTVPGGRQPGQTIAPRATDQDYQEYLAYAKEIGAQKIMSREEFDRQAANYGGGDVRMSVELGLPDATYTREQLEAIKRNRYLNSRAENMGDQAAFTINETPTERVEKPGDILNGSAGRVFVDLSKWDGKEALDPWVFRTALSQLAPEYNITPAEIQQEMEYRASNKTGGYTSNLAGLNPQQAIERIRQENAQEGISKPIYEINMRFDALNNILNRRTNGTGINPELQAKVREQTVQTSPGLDSSFEDTQREVARREAEQEVKARVRQSVENPSWQDQAEQGADNLMGRIIRKGVLGLGGETALDLFGTVSPNNETDPEAIRRKVETEINKRLDKLNAQYGGDWIEVKRGMDYVQQMSDPEYLSRLVGIYARSVIQTAISGPLKGIDVVDSLLETLNPISWAQKGLELIPDDGFGLKKSANAILNYIPRNIRTVGNLIGLTYGALTGKDFTATGLFDGAEKRFFFTLGARLDKELGQDKYLREHLMAQLASGLGSATGFMLLGFLAPEISINSKLFGELSVMSGITGGLGQAGEGYAEAKNAGMTEAGSLAMGAGNFLLGATEMFGIGSSLNRALGEEGRATFWREFGRWLKETGRTAGREALEEGLQEFVQTTGGKILTDFGVDPAPFLQRLKNAAARFPQQIASTAVREAPVAALTGGIFGAGTHSLFAEHGAKIQSETPEIIDGTNSINWKNNIYRFDPDNREAVDRWMRAEKGIEDLKKEIEDTLQSNTPEFNTWVRAQYAEMKVLQERADRLREQAQLNPLTEVSPEAEAQNAGLVTPNVAQQPTRPTTDSAAVNTAFQALREFANDKLGKDPQDNPIHGGQLWPLDPEQLSTSLNNLREAFDNRDARGMQFHLGKVLEVMNLAYDPNDMSLSREVSDQVYHLGDELANQLTDQELLDHVSKVAASTKARGLSRETSKTLGPLGGRVRYITSLGEFDPLTDEAIHRGLVDPKTLMPTQATQAAVQEPATSEPPGEPVKANEQQAPETVSEPQPIAPSAEPERGPVLVRGF
ncbi:MAG TPA: phage tail tip lysozyme, partial [Pyrinomonadaceae bacterium]|nr:phage tail tip lysozyme [Pyrinomonadaceae bacterium]